MSHQKTTTEKTVTQINNDDRSPDSPAVIAYRLGQVESAVKEGFASHNTKLDSLISNFATKAEVLEIKSQAHEEHQRLWSAIKETNTSVEVVQTTVDGISKSNVSMSLVKKAVFGFIGIVLFVVINALVQNLLHIN